MQGRQNPYGNNGFAQGTRNLNRFVQSDSDLSSYYEFDPRLQVETLIGSMEILEDPVELEAWVLGTVAAGIGLDRTMMTCRTDNTISDTIMVIHIWLGAWYDKLIVFPDCR